MGVFLILTYFKVYVNENLCFFHNVPFGVDSRMLLWYHIFEKKQKGCPMEQKTESFINAVSAGQAWEI